MKAVVFPGQGSQAIGMGEALFNEFPDLVKAADAILGYSIKELCLTGSLTGDPQKKLRFTRYTQPALYVVHALSYLKKYHRKTTSTLSHETPNFLAGHSLGEFSALFAAGVFDFQTGLQLVKKRGELMEAAPKGSMAAVMNCSESKIKTLLQHHDLECIDIANFNASTQIVISGPTEAIHQAQSIFEAAGAKYVLLNISIASHSRYMQPVMEQFGAFLDPFQFLPPQIPVISNVTGRPYQAEQLKKSMVEQMGCSVRWTDSIEYLIQQGVITFDELGPSETLSKLIRQIQEEYRPTLPKQLPSKPLARPRSTVTHRKRPQANAKQDIAIIGISGRFAGAENLRDFWHNIAAGKSTITTVPKDRWNHEAYYDADSRKPNKTHCNVGGFLSNIDQFDPMFFNMSGKEAELSDPQQRLFLEEAWNALEDAGYANEAISNSKCGVFAGLELGEYFHKTMADKEEQEAQSFWGKDSSIATARISYFLNLTGPSLAVNTATSSSLTAVHLACQSILLGESDIALAGGAFLCITPSTYLWGGKAGVLSAQGLCRAFDKAADGLVPAEGVGVVFLKPLEIALNDRDHVYGVIKGSAIHQEGKTSGLMTPNALAQSKLYTTVYEKSGINPDSLQYIEAHSAGTQVGDPVEVEGLNRAFQRYTPRRHFCAIGSVKTNIGHAFKASGIAGLLKVVLALQHKQIPASLHFTQANPKIPFENSPFYVNTKLRDWEKHEGEPRRAAVTSIGMGGSNVHVVVEEAPPVSKLHHKAFSHYLIVLSAKTETALLKQVENLNEWLGKNTNQQRSEPHTLEDISYTLLLGRKHFNHRCAFVVESLSDCQQKLADLQKSWAIQRGAPVGAVRTQQTLNIEDKQAIFQQLKSIQNLSAKELNHCLNGLSRLYESGNNFNWSDLFQGSQAKRVSLPTYPFERKRYWITPKMGLQATLTHHPQKGSMTQTIESFLRQLFSEELKLSPNKVQPDTPLDEYGLDSVHRAHLLKALEDKVGKLPPTLLFEYQSLSELAEYFSTHHASAFVEPSSAKPIESNDQQAASFRETTTISPMLSLRETAAISPVPPQPSKVSANPSSLIDASSETASVIEPSPVRSKSKISQTGVAVVGMSGRYLGAKNLEEFWETLKTEKAGGPFDKTVTFDPKFFQLSPEKAKLLRETEMIFLEEAWKTLEDASHSPKKEDFSTGLFVVGVQSYKSFDLIQHISDYFGFNRPNDSYDSMNGMSSLSVIHLACNKIEKGDCASALVGGVSEQGVGCLFLKSLNQAVTDRNHIYGVLKGSQAKTPKRRNQDLLSKAAIQKKLYKRVLKASGTPPENITYIESLSTGSAQDALGGMTGAVSAFQSYKAKMRSCAIGSLTSNWESLGAATGVAGIIKVLLQIKYQKLLPSALASMSHDILPLDDTPFAYQNHYEMWEAPRCACVSTQEGNTQAGMIVEEYLDSSREIILLSAMTPGQLRAQATNLKKHLSQSFYAHQTLQDVAYTLTFRKAMPVRLALIVKNKEALFDKLTAFLEGGQESSEMIYRPPIKLNEWQEAHSSSVEESVIQLWAKTGKLDLIGKLWVSGTPIDWAFLYPPQQVYELSLKRISLPMYPFEPPQELNSTESDFPRSPTLDHATSKLAEPDSSGDTAPPEGIAIIGVSGRYPMADDLEAFWENLVVGKDCITVIPEDRWDYRQYLASNQAQTEPPLTETCYNKWGGFLNDIDQFDPLFFNIAPKEAALMDPQERLFLQTAWATMEDAGYTRDSLGKRVGVFVGALYGHYQLFSQHDVLAGSQKIPSSWLSSIANRVSYCLDLHGPSIAVDTMCSGSLTAIHLACESIRNGESDLAFAGGVNLSLHPQKYLLLSQGGFLSSDGRCRSFGDGGDGYVPGEGVGAVLLKPFSQAILDQDLIYGIIRGSSANHGGRTTGYTVPSPHSQGALILETLKKAQVAPETISYLEAHGTGTSLGDPIEVSGLVKAFDSSSLLSQSCAIGSVKSNIGHLEAASGIAGITKVLLQMKHKQLVPSLHANALNPKIQFENTPFYVQQHLAEWQTSAPYVPRRAGVSSFGAGGANAHVIIEEFVSSTLAKVTEDGNPQLIILSAKSESALTLYIERMLRFLTNSPQISLADMAYTLQVGREAMPVRLAIVVSDRQELIYQWTQLKDQLSEIVTGSKQIEGVYYHNHSTTTHSPKNSQRLKANNITTELPRLAQDWVQGRFIDWETLYSGKNKKISKRISLPTYPFAKESYWLFERSSLKETLCFRYQWEKSELPRPSQVQDDEDRFLIFDQSGETTKLLEALLSAKPLKSRVVRVMAGDEFQPIDSYHYQINLERKNDYHQLLQTLKSADFLPNKILYLWNDEIMFSSWETLLQDWSKGVYSVLFLTQALMAVHQNQKPIRVLYVYPNNEEKTGVSFAALSSFFNTVHFEHPKFLYQSIEIFSNDSMAVPWTSDRLEKLLNEFDAMPEGQQRNSLELIRYSDAQRWQRTLKATEWEIKGNNFPLIKENGVYLITGGMGGIGLLFANYILSQAKANVVLCGRSPLNTTKWKRLQEQNVYESEVIYLQADVAQQNQVEALMAQIRSKYHCLDGILHSAGTHHYSFVLQKTQNEMETVLAPKVHGALLLDEATTDEPLDFFVLFSSITVKTELAGHSDYAYANAFLDHFAERRETLRKQKKRFGKTLSINWPLWQEGGMTWTDTEKRLMANDFGLHALPTDDAMHMFEQALGSQEHQWFVTYGEREKLRQTLGSHPPVTTLISVPKTSLDPLDLRTATESFLKQILSDIIELPIPQISIHQDFAEYGLDSLMMMELSGQMEKKWGVLPKTLLLECKNIHELVEHLQQHYSAQLQQAFTPIQTKANSLNTIEPSSHKVPTQMNQRPFSLEKEAIAIVGLSGRFPGAADLAEYWKTLKSGKNAITEVPESRWDYKTFYDPNLNKAKEGKIYCKWGAFLEEVDLFDPLFFGITPLEAKTIPPEERLLLESVWSTLHSGDLTPDRLKNQKIGVFVGITTNTYGLLGIKTKDQALQSPFDGSFSSFPNRVSYFFNFSGPSLAIDTACSSSLVAIHTACESIHNGSTEAAIAGGINLYFHPSKYLRMCQNKLLATSPEGAVFAAHKNGFIPGEGVGTVLLKPLSKAEKVKNRIYGIIKSSVVVHKGKSNGYLNPSPQSQASLIEEAIRQANVDAESIGYVDLQAIGSEFSDLAEWEGLNRAFRKFSSEKQFCAIGSVKPNIGHAEAASGMAQLLKVLLQMQYRYLVPTAFATAAKLTPPPEASPFRLQTTGNKWKSRSGLPRRAGVGSFGAWGVSAYLILEESPHPLEGKLPVVSQPFQKVRCWVEEEEPSPEANSRISQESKTVGAYYDELATTVETEEELDNAYLIFPPFQQKIKNFSWLLALVASKAFPEHFERMRMKQAEFKATFYRLVDFSKVHKVMDVGCGLSTDLIHLAESYPNLKGNGYTVSPAQAQLGNRRIAQKGLETRLEVFCRDSAKDAFPNVYDLIIGFEVIFHIKDKQGVFNNIAEHLHSNGRLVLTDCIANTVTSIDSPHVGHYTNTIDQFSQVLADNGLKIVDCVDASQEISHFLDDPHFETNLTHINEKFPDMKQREGVHRGWNNFGKTLSSRLIQYVVLTIQKADIHESHDTVFQANQSHFQNPTPYSDLFKRHPEMEKPISYAPLPIPLSRQRASQESDLAETKATAGQLAEQVQQTIMALASEALEIPKEQIDVTAPFIDYGIDSLIGVILLDNINRFFEVSLSVSVIYDCPSISELSQYMAQHCDLSHKAFSLEKSLLPPFQTKQSNFALEIPREKPKELDHTVSQEVAVIGMSGRFPGAKTVEAFWENLKEGIQSITEVPRNRWDSSLYYDPSPQKNNRTSSKWGGFLADIDQFDAAFFKISPSEAKIIDPHQRLFLEESWKALEDTGYASSALNQSRCGVFVGVSGNEYLLLQEKANRPGQRGQALVGNTHSILASRIAYYLNLKGPAISMDTACSSSLVAVHMAAKTLQQREADLMLAGGITLYFSELPYLDMSQAGMLSPTGKCNAFDASADGIVVGEAVGVVVLKPLDKALKAGDRIYGVIKGSAINQDGKTNGITAPSMESQKQLQLTVYETSGISPETISYVETHGTGTPLGDPIEITALMESFQHYTQQTGFCALGAVKSNIGHTSQAAGVVSLIKVLLCLKYRQIPGMPHYQETNPHINWEKSPFYISPQLIEWTASPKRAAINSFGISGTNCHLLVEEAPPVPQKTSLMLPPQYLFVLSAKTLGRLRVYAKAVRGFLKGQKANDFLYNLTYSLQIGRQPMEARIALVVSDVKDLDNSLARYLEGDGGSLNYFYSGTVDFQQTPIHLLEQQGLTAETLSQQIQQNRLPELAQLWVNGIVIDWDLFYSSQSSGEKPNKISLPTYPFVPTRYWFMEVDSPSQSISSLPLLLKTNFLNSDYHVFPHLPKFNQAFEAFDTYAKLKLLNAFQRMGVFQKNGERYQKDQLKKHLQIQQGHFRWFEALLQILKEAQFLDIQNKTLITQNLETSNFPYPLNQLDGQKSVLLKTFPEIAPYIELLSISVEAYPEMIRGETSVVSVLFPKGSSALVEGIYYGNALTDYFHKIVAFVIQSVVQEKRKHDPTCDIRILEVGAGTGGTSRFVMKAIQAYMPHLYYYFTDITSGFTVKAREQFAKDYPFVIFKTLNIEKPLDPEWTDTPIDIVFGSNVLHATKQMSATFQQVKRLLKPDGLLLVNEMTQKDDFLTIMFGGLDGWWLFEDIEHRLSHSPLLSPMKWQELFKTHGFHNFQAFGLPNTPWQEARQNVMIGQLSEASFESEHKVPSNPQTSGSFETKQGKPETAPADIKTIFSNILDIEIGTLDEHVAINDYGVDSMNALQIFQALNETYQVDLDLSHMGELSTISKLSEWIATHSPVMEGKYQLVPDTLEKGLTVSFQRQQLFLENYNYMLSQCTPDIAQNSNVLLLETSPSLKMEVVICGAGAPLVLLSPLNCLVTAWSRQIAALARHFKIICFHYPGFGQSDFSMDVSDLTTMTETFLKLLRGLLEEESFHLAGWSFGGGVAQMMALKSPEQVKTLSLICTAAKRGEPYTVENIQKLNQILLDNFHKWVPAKMQSQKESSFDFIRGTDDSQIIFHYLKQIYSLDLENQLAQITCPTLIVNGGNDLAVPADHGQVLHQALPHSEFHIIKKGGHYLPLQNSTYFNRVLLKFLRKYLSY